MKVKKTVSKPVKNKVAKSVVSAKKKPLKKVSTLQVRKSAKPLITARSNSKNIGRAPVKKVTKEAVISKTAVKGRIQTAEGWKRSLLKSGK